MLPALVAAGANIIGGIMGQNAADENREAQMQLARENMALQREFAQQGIRWKVEDAKAAGVHPLYALGANTVSYAPVSVGSLPGSPMASALAAAGQDVSRAMNATSTSSERQVAFSEAAAKLQLDNMSLQNQLLASRIATLNQGGGNPPIPETGPLPPVPEAKKQEDRPPLQMAAQRWMTDPGTSSMEAWEKRYGDEGPVNWIAQAGVAFNDLKRNYGQPQTWPTQIMQAAWNSLSREAKEEYGNLQRFIAMMRSTRLP